MESKIISADLNAKGLNFAIVVSRFNDFLTKQLLEGALDCILRHGGTEEKITIIWVPGANEIPTVAKKLAVSEKYSAIIALGAVVQGATSHASLINSQVSRSLSAISIDLSIPIINGVVTADTLEQAIERCGTKAGNKGWTAAQAAIEMANIFKNI